MTSCWFQTGGCGGGCGGGSGSDEGLGGLGDLTGILIGFLLARAVSGAASSSLFRVAIDQPPATNGGRMTVGGQQKIVLSPETVNRSKVKGHVGSYGVTLIRSRDYFSVEAMRKENGFGFLWGAKSARVLRKMVDEVERGSPAKAQGVKGPPRPLRPIKPMKADVKNQTTMSLNSTELLELERALNQTNANL